MALRFLLLTTQTIPENIIHEYGVNCSETITCSDPKNDKVVVGIAESQVELSKRAIKHVTLPVIHRMDWLRRHNQKDNLTNQNIKFNFSNEMMASVANVIKVSNKKIKIQIKKIMIGFTGAKARSALVK